jgi:DNA-directed RNA polymerase subunit RPC12/RpoP
MATFLGFAALASPVILALLLHIYRDVRGRARNARGVCYSCGRPYVAAEICVVNHHKGGTYVYCKRCGSRHELWKGIAVSVAAALGALTMFAYAMANHDADPLRSYLVAGIAFSILALVTLIGVRSASRKR